MAERERAQAALNSLAPSEARETPGTPSSMSVSLLNLLLESRDSTLRVRKHPFQLPTASFRAVLYRVCVRAKQGRTITFAYNLFREEFRGSRTRILSEDPKSGLDRSASRKGFGNKSGEGLRNARARDRIKVSRDPRKSGV